MRPYQKVVLVVGCVWAVVVPLLFVMDIAAGYEGKGTAWITTTFVPLLILWWPTGVLAHVIEWFKTKS